MFFNFQNHIVLKLLDSSYLSSRAKLNISIVPKYLLTNSIKNIKICSIKKTEI